MKPSIDDFRHSEVQKQYDKFLEKWKKIALFIDAASMLNWHLLTVAGKC